MLNKSFSMNLDINSSNTRNTGIELVQYDIGSYDFVFTIYDEDVVQSLAAVDHCVIFFSRSDGSVVQDTNIDISATPTSGIVNYSFTNNSAAVVPGEVEGEIKFYDAGHTIIMTSSKFNFSVRESIDNTRSLQATSEYSELQTLTASITAEESDRVSAENDRLSAEVDRLASEIIRVSSEGTRVSNEEGRVSVEEVRVSNEEGRVSVEEVRVSNEEGRVSVEEVRVSNEEGRVSAEESRVKAEDIRVSQFSAINASPKGVYADVAALTTAIPAGDDSIYLALDNGNWYYWNGAAWTSGGVYQSTGIADGSVTPLKTSFLTPSINLFNAYDENNVEGYYLERSAGALPNALYGYSHMITATPGETFTLYNPHPNYNKYAVFFDSEDGRISDFATPTYLTTVTATAPANTAYMRINYYLDDKDLCMAVVGSELPDPYVAFSYTLDRSIMLGIDDDIDIPDGSVTPLKTSFLTPSINLFNAYDENNVEGYYLERSAGALPNALYGYSHMITATPGETFTLYNPHPNYNKYAVFFDDDDVRLSDFATPTYLTTVTAVAPANTAYMRINYYLDDKAVCMAVVGDTLPDPYVAFSYDLDTSVLLGTNGLSNVGEEFGLDTLRKPLCVVKSGVNIAVRVEWDETNDFYTLWQYPIVINNLGLNMVGMYTCPKAQSLSVIDGTLWKSSGDDLNTLFMNNSYVGGNHGWQISNTITAEGHGKENVDIGSVWEIGGIHYIIVDVVSADSLLVMSDYQGSQTVPCVALSGATGTLTHLSGATNTDDIVYTAKAVAQITPGVNNPLTKIVIDGKEIESDGVYLGNTFDIVESYDIIDIPALQTFLKAGVGSETKPDLADPTLDTWIRVTDVYSHGRNGSITNKSSLHYLKTTAVGHAITVMASPIGVKMYVPGMGVVGGLDLSTVVTQPTSTAVQFLKTDWLDANKPPYRYHQFNDDLSSGLALGYNQAFGVCTAEIRKTMAATAGYFSKAKKMYPYSINTATAAAGRYDEMVAFRIPLKVVDSDATDVYWYWVGDDIYLAFDYHISVDKTLPLPSYLAGKKIEQIDIHSNTTVQSEIVSSLGIKIKVINNYGYGVLRLYD